MKVYVAGKVYDTNKTPIMLKLTREEKANISDLWETHYRYLSGPDDMTEDEMDKILDADLDEIEVEDVDECPLDPYPKPQPLERPRYVVKPVLQGDVWLAGHLGRGGWVIRNPHEFEDEESCQKACDGANQYAGYSPEEVRAIENWSRRSKPTPESNVIPYAPEEEDSEEEDLEEQQRRDEKHGLYPDKEDITN